MALCQKTFPPFVSWFKKSETKTKKKTKKKKKKKKKKKGFLLTSPPSFLLMQDLTSSFSICSYYHRLIRKPKEQNDCHEFPVSWLVKSSVWWVLRYQILQQPVVGECTTYVASTDRGMSLMLPLCWGTSNCTNHDGRRKMSFTKPSRWRNVIDNCREGLEGEQTINLWGKIWIQGARYLLREQIKQYFKVTVPTASHTMVYSGSYACMGIPVYSAAPAFTENLHDTHLSFLPSFLLSFLHLVQH